MTCRYYCGGNVMSIKLPSAEKASLDVTYTQPSTIARTLALPQPIKTDGEAIGTFPLNSWT